MYWDKKHDELIVLDFDHTLFNTTKYVEAVQKYFKAEFGVSGEEFAKEREAVKDCCVVVDIDKFIARLSYDDKKAMHEAMIRIIEDRANDFLWDDVVDFVKRHESKFDMVLLTHGDEELQRAKIVNSDLSKVPYLITARAKSEKIASHVKRYKKMYFIDDKPENVAEMKQAFPEADVYLMKRPDDQPYGGDKVTCDCEYKEIRDLRFALD